MKRKSILHHIAQIPVGKGSRGSTMSSILCSRYTVNIPQTPRTQRDSSDTFLLTPVKYTAHMQLLSEWYCDKWEIKINTININTPMTVTTFKRNGVKYLGIGIDCKFI